MLMGRIGGGAARMRRPWGGPRIGIGGMPPNGPIIGPGMGAIIGAIVMGPMGPIIMGPMTRAMGGPN
jgi:hypothetical protein